MAKTSTDKAKDAIVKALNDQSVNVPLLVNMLIQESPWMRGQMWNVVYYYLRLWKIKGQHPTSDMTPEDHGHAFVMTKVLDLVERLKP